MYFLQFCLCRFSHVFTADSGNSLGDLIGHSSAVNNISFRPERPFRLVSASEDNSLCFYEGPPFKFKISLKVCLCDLCTVNSYNVYLGDSDLPGSVLSNKSEHSYTYSLNALISL